MNNTALNVELREIKKYLEGENVTEVSINRPGELFVEDDGEIKCYEVPSLTYNKLHSLATLIASSNGQSINEAKPTLSGSLPDGERIQIVIPPCVESGTVCMSIRKPASRAFKMEDYQQNGAFDEVKISDGKEITDEDSELCSLLSQNKIYDFIEKSVKYKKNILVSGGTSTGKTTFANTLIELIPATERLMTIEDTRETILSQPNKVHLLCSKGQQGTSKVDVQDLLEVCLRLRPDRILLSELRGMEAFSYLRAVNTGHSGSITTLHADTPKGAYEQLVLMVTQAGLGLKREEILEYIHSVVDVVIQLKRINGKRQISEVYFEHYQHAP
ncbi:MAG: P-type DNA transfer ATPase VirB11 [Sedimenticola sp.]